MRNIIGFVLDKSGSMEECRDETISAFNEFLREQQGEARRRREERLLTLALFDAEWSQGQGTTGYAVAYDAVPVGDVPELTRENYVPSGGTALYDAIARTVSVVEAAGRFEKVVVAILTDGQENSSRRASAQDARTLIARKESEGWVFVYLAATADDFSTEEAHVQADVLGIDAPQRIAFSKMDGMREAMSSNDIAISRYLRGERRKEEFFDND